jgi:cysteine synthase
MARELASDEGQGGGGGGGGAVSAAPTMSNKMVYSRVKVLISTLTTQKYLNYA